MTDGSVQACPECDSPNCTPRPTKGIWACRACGAEFDEPIRRNSHRDGPRDVNRNGKFVSELLEADPDELLADE